jgi:hypothetical protein
VSEGERERPRFSSTASFFLRPRFSSKVRVLGLGLGLGLKLGLGLGLGPASFFWSGERERLEGDPRVQSSRETWMEVSD